MAPLQKDQELRSLFSQWLQNNGDETIIHRLSELAEEPELQETWQSLLFELPDEMQPELIEQQHAAIFDKVYQNLIETEPGLMPAAPVRHMRPWRKYAAAAAIIILFAAGGFYLFNTGKDQPANEKITEINPGKTLQQSDNNKAILTLGSGKQIILDTSANGKLAQQSGAEVIKSENGQIIYQLNDSITASQQPIDTNTVSTPRGGEYTITLPDGSIAWLNAASSISFPTAFRGSERTVTVQGEVYLQVAKNSSQPFRVKVKDASIDVLGTSFNVNAYAEEPISKITLLEGSISLKKGNERKIMKPGQQVWFRENSNALNFSGNIDTEQVVAWKDGTFDFRDQPFESVMNQIARWYDMEIVYEGTIPDVKILGIMSRNTSLSIMLKSFELTTGIKFKIENNTKPGRIIIQR